MKKTLLAPPLIGRVLIVILMGYLRPLSASLPCPDDYTPSSFEEAGEGLDDLLEAYLRDANLTLPPAPSQLRRLGLRRISSGEWQRPGTLLRKGRGRYPYRPGLWRVEAPPGGIVTLHLLLREPNRLPQTEAFNHVNDLLDDAFGDYDDEAYGMRLLPEEIRRRWRGRYLGIGAVIYGVLGDATELDRTITEIILRDYTPWVEQYEQCGKKR
ncbi:hypothetical protein [Nitratifractor sp.]